MNDHAKLDALFTEHGYTNFQWINPEDIVVAQWVRMKCMFGCGSYGRNASCPPNLPSVAECRQFLDEYRSAVIFHFAKQVAQPEDRKPWSKQVNHELTLLERAVFLAGYPKAFLLAMDSCTICADCPGAREECKNPKTARPSPEALAIDVFSTVRRHGLPIEVLSDYTQAMNRYAFLLID
jgi:predicted metal-binding protein